MRDIVAPLPGAVVTIGNFDGVHLGHREIFRQVVARAREIDGTSVVLTFSPHPRKVLTPDQAPLQINTDAEKERLIEASCIDVLVCVPFTREIAGLSAEMFVRDILVARIGVRRLVIGYDYAFGRNRAGNADFLAQQGDALGFAVEVLGPIIRDGEIFSSTRIRELIQAGDVAEAARLLGRHFNLEGEVVHGAGRGRQLGFPTANLRADKELLPQAGVYAVKVRLGDALLDGAVNIGCNPTFSGGNVSVEVHLFDFDRQIYGETVRLYFIARLREERVFANAADLSQAIREDVRRAREILIGAQIRGYREYLDCGHPGAK
ncbi:MAG: bifunctional riboflavin kinase/FAD synthetase [Saccharofermentanales bacterium]